MTHEVSVYPCPADSSDGAAFTDDAECGRTFTSENGAVMHALNTKDEHHDVVGSKPDGYDLLESHAVPVGEVSDPGRPDKGSADDGTDADDGTPGQDADGGDDDGDDGGRLEPRIPPADTSTDGGEQAAAEEAACPACGESLGMRRARVEALIRSRGPQECGECGATLEVGD
jgi:hypothetical protein